MGQSGVPDIKQLPKRSLIQDSTFCVSLCPGWFCLHNRPGLLTLIDEDEQKALYRWQLDWPSFEKGYEGSHERRRGIDVLHFKDGKIIRKLTYSKTTLEIDGERVRLTAK